MKNLPVNSLNFNELKDNLKEFLKDNPNYKDFNFEASGINTLLNALAYNAHSIGFFTKMLMDESFIDSAHTKQALVSHAKRSGYIPKGMKSAKAEVLLYVSTDVDSEPAGRTIVLERGATFTAVNSQDDQRIFTVLDGVNLTERFTSLQDLEDSPFDHNPGLSNPIAPPDNPKLPPLSPTGNAVFYRSPRIELYEGDLRVHRYIVDSSVLNQRFIIRDDTIDIDTIRVHVYPYEGATERETFHLAKNMTTVAPDSKVFYVTTDENQNYQILFGGNLFGEQPENGNIVELTYISTSGPEGNGAKVFKFNAPAPGGADTNIGNFEDFGVTTLAQSAGGLLPQSEEDLRFAIPQHYRRQNRVFTAGDFREILLSEFRNIDSINVWGGEDHIFKDYGKVYISVKPKYSNRLTSQARENIRADLVKRFGVVGIDAVFVDPEFITVDLVVTLKVDKSKTNLSSAEIRNNAINAIQEYDTNHLSKFDTILSDIDLLNFLRGDNDYITTLWSSKVIRKDKQQLHGSDAISDIYFGNTLVPGTIKSTSLTYGTMTVTIGDDATGRLWLFDQTGKNLNISAGTVDYQTGKIGYRVPADAKVTGYESSNIGVLEFRAVPKIPDINTSLNNIVRIGKIEAIVT